MSMSEELMNRFMYHPARTLEVQDQHTRIREASALFASLVVSLTPVSREQSLAITKIEEAMMWANAAIARDPANASQETHSIELDPIEGTFPRDFDL